MTLDAYIVTPTPHQFGLGNVQGMKFYTTETLSGKLKVFKPFQSKSPFQSEEFSPRVARFCPSCFVGTNAFLDLIKGRVLHNSFIPSAKYTIRT